ncbi:MAG: PASTA domain-containing protein [Gemmatimonadaceae bacterium]
MTRSPSRRAPSDRLRRILQYVLLAAAGFMLAYLLVAFAIIPDDVASADITIPSVVGLTQGDAERRLVSLGLSPVLGESRFSGDAPKSTVLGQEPSAGTVVAPGATVMLDVSSGQQRSTIPGLEGLTRDNASRALAEAGLQLGQVEEQSSDAVRGEVLDSRPGSGQVVPRGTRVDLVVSAGPAELVMPDVVGRDVTSARSLLELLGLALDEPAYDTLSTLPVGTVVAQSPAAGSPVSVGAAVALRVAGRS